MPLQSLLELSRIVEHMAKFAPPRHRELVRGMVAELDSIGDRAERARFALGATAAIARLALCEYGRTTVHAPGGFVGVREPQPNTNLDGPQEAEMLGKPFGIVLLAAVLFASGLAGVVAFWGAFPASPATSPLAALFALAWTGAYVGAALSTWHRSRLAGPAFVVAMALALPLVYFIFPSQVPFLPLLGVVSLFAVVGFWYLHRAAELVT